MKIRVVMEKKIVTFVMQVVMLVVIVVTGMDIENATTVMVQVRLNALNVVVQEKMLKAKIVLNVMELEI